MEKYSCPIAEAAQIFGLAECTLRREYIRTGLVKPVDLGSRGKSIIVDELRAAIESRVASQRANPALVKHRNAGAKIVAQGKVANPYGRRGKPKLQRA